MTRADLSAKLAILHSFPLSAFPIAVAAVVTDRSATHRFGSYMAPLTGPDRGRVHWLPFTRPERNSAVHQSPVRQFRSDLVSCPDRRNLPGRVLEPNFSRPIRHPWPRFDDFQDSHACQGAHGRQLLRTHLRYLCPPSSDSARIPVTPEPIGLKESEGCRGVHGSSGFSRFHSAQELSVFSPPQLLGLFFDCGTGVPGYRLAPNRFYSVDRFCGFRCAVYQPGQIISTPSCVRLSVIELGS